MDLLKLIELSQANPLRMTIETTVTTGFESVAIDECREKFVDITELCKARGRIYFNIDISQMPLVHSMRSVDNVFVVADAIPSIGFQGSDMKEDLKLIDQYVTIPDWKKMMSIWRGNESFEGICYPTSKQYLHSLEIEQALKEKARIAVELNGDCANQGDSAPSDSSYMDDRLSAANLDEHRCGEFVKPNPFGPLTQKQHEMLVARHKAVVARAYSSLDQDRSPREKVLKYRVTCYRSGMHTFRSQDAACCFGGELQDMYHWIVDLDLYDMEIILGIKQDVVCVSIALTKESKHRRNIRHFGPTTLRATVCYCLLHLGKPRVGDVIVDPMCGGGSIPIEGMIAWSGVYHMGGELHPKAVLRSHDNVRDLALERKQYIDLVSWDVTNLPLKDSCIDLIAIDLPFGRRSGSKKDNRVLYREALQELARVVRMPHGRAVLLTEDRRSFMKVIPPLRNLWKLKKTLGVNIGGLDAAVYVLKRSTK